MSVDQDSGNHRRSAFDMDSCFLNKSYSSFDMYPLFEVLWSKKRVLLFSLISQVPAKLMLIQTVYTINCMLLIPGVFFF